MSAAEFLVLFWGAWAGWQARCWWTASPGTADRWLSGLMFAIDLGAAVAWSSASVTR